ncbi:DUF5655 domain-containing protein [Agromyces laixinhei]|uniref:DUF5655 domain-containing protein n=1 Tax=Agromyces laixinhei TaxID=2585717 RepID=UPI001116F01E|nr:DUF5655 domain-containing protein [Agromyces laixinhei]
MAEASWHELTGDLDDDDLAMITAFRRFCRGLPDVEERVHTSEVAYAGARVFASGYIKSHYLELGIELLREVTDPKPRTSFATSKRVTMHRYSLRHPEQFDDAIRALIREASETVGPGTRTGGTPK